MSFFADMIAGGIAGAGKGMSDYAVMREREDDKRAQLEAQAELKRELAKQRSDDLAMQRAMQRDMFEARYGQGGSGSGGGSGSKGGSGSYFEQKMREAKTTEEQDSVIREARMRAGDDAAAALSEYYGRPMTQTVSEFDPAEAERMSRRDYAEANPTAEASKTVTKAISYDKDKGAQALNRLIAMADAAKYDDYTKGETTATKLDAAKGAAVGKSPEEAAAIIQSYTGNSDQRVIDSKEKMNDARIAAKKPTGGGGTSSPNTIFKTVTDDRGNVYGVRRDGTKVDLEIKSDSFNRQVAALVTKMESEDPKLRKMPESQKRDLATERLVGARGETQAPAAKTEKWARVDGKLVKVN